MWVWAKKIVFDSSFALIRCHALIKSRVAHFWAPVRSLIEITMNAGSRFRRIQHLIYRRRIHDGNCNIVEMHQINQNHEMHFFVAGDFFDLNLVCIFQFLLRFLYLYGWLHMYNVRCCHFSICESISKYLEKNRKFHVNALNIECVGELVCNAHCASM